MDYRIEELLTKIHSNFMNASNIEQMAESSGISVSYLQHLFKKEVGQSVKKYINDLRLEKARELLEITNLRVIEIRVKVGAADEARFLQDFKRKFGSTPTEYRRNYRK